MAESRKRGAGGAAAASAEAAPPTPDEVEAEAQEIADDQQQATAAQQRREAEMDRRQEARSTYPEDADPPEQVTKGGEAAYSHERLLRDAAGFGFQEHVLAGALHGNDEAYLTVSEAERLVEDFLGREV